MPRYPFFSRLGLFVDESFLEAGLCLEFCSALQSAAEIKACVITDGQEVVNEEMRQVSVVKPPVALKSLLKERLREVQPKLATHFGVALHGFEAPCFLAYHEGDFYAVHQDSNSHSPLEYLARRVVSVVIFLNSATEIALSQPNTYTGGELTFYGLLTEPPWDKCPLPLSGEQGLLVAFPSEVRHAVRPVTEGTRYTVVTWFY